MGKKRVTLGWTASLATAQVATSVVWVTLLCLWWSGVYPMLIASHPLLVSAYLALVTLASGLLLALGRSAHLRSLTLAAWILALAFEAGLLVSFLLIGLSVLGARARAQLAQSPFVVVAVASQALLSLLLLISTFGESGAVMHACRKESSLASKSTAAKETLTQAQGKAAEQGTRK